MNGWSLDVAPALSTLTGIGTVAILALLLAGGMTRAFPGLAERVLAGARGRSGELDGMRGGLCLLVLLHHSIIMRNYCATGHYDAPSGNFDNLAGEAAVALFFVTTAYLYWGRMLRGGRFAWPSLILGRLRRLTPMYVVSVAVLVAIVMSESGFTLKVPPAELAVEIGHWLSFDFLSLPDINALPDTYYIQVVLWTLRYEWLFVLSLPLLALFRRGRLPWLLYALGMAAAFGSGTRPGLLFAYFVAGLLAAHLRLRLEGRVPPAVWGGIGLAALVVLLAVYHDVYGPGQIMLLMLVFLGAGSGAGPWAVLRRRPMQFLGLISYSVYLLHHMVLHLVSTRLFGPARFAQLKDWELQGTVLMIGATVIVLSTLTFLLVERPWIHPAPGPRG